MTRFFYDTEFLENGRTIELISIGIVTEDGDEYYAVNRHVPWGRIRNHPWLMDNVVPYLPTLVGGDAIGLDLDHAAVRAPRTIAAEVERFVVDHGSEDRQGNELWAYYGAYDHVALSQLWGPMVYLPDCMPMFTCELMQLWDTAGRPQAPPQSDEHHALADAEWNRKLFAACRNELTALSDTPPPKED